MMTEKATLMSCGIQGPSSLLAIMFLDYDSNLGIYVFHLLLGDVGTNQSKHLGNSQILAASFKVGHHYSASI